MAMIIGKKLGMTQLFDETGQVTPVSVIEAGPCPIVQIKTDEKEGYGAIQIGFGAAKANRTTRPLAGHFKKANVDPQRVLREVRVDDTSTFNVGDNVDLTAFEGVGKVHVSGVSKGRGFAGTVKRHGFHIGRKTHGSHSHREPGAVGNCATPSRIFKGKRLPGQMGAKNLTVKNLSVVQIDAENNLLFVKGAIPGANNGIVYIHSAS